MTENDENENTKDRKYENSRIFDEPELKIKEKIILFEYKTYLTSEQMNKKTNLLLYVIEKGPNPYIYYLMNKINNILKIDYKKTCNI
jgi:hypothetical protein